jgi:hypothetical protein
MSLKRLSLMVAAVLALTAVVATSANAAVSTTAAQWFKNGTALTETGVAIEGEKTENGIFKSEIGTTKIELQSTQFSCSGCTIFNKAVTSKAGAVATGSGQIVFEIVTVLKPSGCTVTGETGIEGVVPTKVLRIHGDWMDTTTTNQHAFVQFLPPEGTTTFAQFELSGGECAGISGKRNVSGSVFGESVNNTGVEAAEQEIAFSGAIQSTSGGGLLLGTKAAELTAKGKFKLTAGGTYKIQ